MRRTLSILCLFAAWLCANGVSWNVVQVVAWAKMYHDFSQTMSAGEALERTFSGEAPCDLCHLASTAEDTARHQLPQESIVGSSEKFLLSCHEAAPAIFADKHNAWPEVVAATALTRGEAVPVPPPRA